MRNKWLIASLLSLVLVGLCGAILAVFWGSIGLLRRDGLRFVAFDDANVSAETTEEQRFSVSGPASLNLGNVVGDVQVTGGAGSEIIVTAHKTAWGTDDADAQAALANLRVTITQTGNIVSVQVERPETYSFKGEVIEGVVSFVVQVPADTAVDAATGYGNVNASGLTGGAVLTSGSGQVTASGLAGEVELHSDYGDVTLERAEPDGVTAFSSSGRVSLEEVDADGAVELTSGYGNVSFEGGTAQDVEASTSSGQVTLSDLAVSGSVNASSDYADVTVTSVTAPDGYNLSSSSGAVKLDGATGSVSAISGYGNVSVINAVDVTLSLISRSGMVSFTGSLGSGPHSLSSDYGNISLVLPPDTAADIELSTGYGTIRSAFPVTLSGNIQEERWTGTLNGGGPSLLVHTDSGAITLDVLDS
jgi:DUF4097 and DUF4098 domain-containing protein YvlB